MHSKWVFKHLYPRSGKRIYLLAALWVIGLLLGILLCGLGSYDHAGLFYGVINSAPAPLSLFFLCLLPVACFAAAFVSPLFLLTCLAMFLSAVSHGFCGMVIYIAVGSAGWLLRPLILFTASCTSVLIWWLALQNKPGRYVRRYTRFALAISCIIYVLDLLVISPFVGDLAKVLLEGFA